MEVSVSGAFRRGSHQVDHWRQGPSSVKIWVEEPARVPTLRWEEAPYVGGQKPVCCCGEREEQGWDKVRVRGCRDWRAWEKFVSCEPIQEMSCYVKSTRTGRMSPSF